MNPIARPNNVWHPSLSTIEHWLLRLQRMWYFFPILFIACYARLWNIDQLGKLTDHATNQSWALITVDSGIFNLYELTNSDYPPLFPMVLTIAESIRRMTPYIDTDPAILPVYRVVPVAAELGLIVVALVWLRHRRVLRWVIPLALSLFPGMIVTTAFWGQSDSIYTLMVVLILIALNQEKPRAAWFFFAVGMLVKFQTVVILPLLVLLTWRRYGARQLLMGVTLAGVVGFVILMPFILESGFSRTFAPYTTSVDRYPLKTANASNIWLLHERLIVGDPNAFGLDSEIALGSLTYKQIGFLLLGTNTLLVCISIWRHSGERREFMWGAALYWGLFVLATQMRDRYLYPGAVLSLLAIAQDVRFWLPSVIGIFTLTYNVVDFTQAPFYYMGMPMYLILRGAVSSPIAVLNTLTLAEILRLMLTRDYRSQVLRWGGRAIIIGLLTACLLVIVSRLPL